MSREIWYFRRIKEMPIRQKEIQRIVDRLEILTEDSVNIDIEFRSMRKPSFKLWLFGLKNIGKQWNFEFRTMSKLLDFVETNYNKEM